MSNPLELKEFLETPESARLGPDTRPGVQAQANLEDQLQPLLEASHLSDESRELVRALILLWHDHLDAAHRIAQEIDTADGSFVHGIMHRREPDFGNAAYWFRKVGRHPAYGEIAKRVRPILQTARETDLSASLIRNGTWDPFAFIDACERAYGNPKAGQRVLREIQKEEFAALLESLRQPRP